jgi:hypothetical protein
VSGGAGDTARTRRTSARSCQLANQVVSQARDCGIRAVALTGKKREFPQLESSEYLNAEVLAVTWCVHVRWLLVVDGLRRRATCRSGS